MRSLRFAASLVFVASTSAQIAAAQTGADAPADPAVEALTRRYQMAADPREADRAFAELRQLADRSPSAALACGTLSSQPGSPAYDRATAIHCLETAARGGSAQAQHRLAMLLLGDTAERERAERLLAAAGRELPDSVFTLALVRAERASDPIRARRDVIERGATMGYAPAQFELARLLHSEGPAGRAAARDWLAKAAAQGHGEAAAELAAQLELDKRESDVPRIVELLEQAAKAGTPRAAYALALRYLQARGVKRDPPRAVALLQQAASAGHAPSQYALGFAIAQGLGTPTDDRLAYAWFARAAAQGNADATFALGTAHANGWGAERDMPTAYEWYCKAAQRGHAGATELVRRSELGRDCALSAKGS